MIHQEISIPNHGQSPKSLIDVYDDKHLKAAQYYQNRAIDILKSEMSTDAHNTNHCNSGNRVNFTVEDILRKNTVNATDSDQDSFYVADLGEVERQFNNWQKLMPRVRPYYAVKCNPNTQVLKTLAKCGAGFDCASKREIELVLANNGSAKDVVYANPCKQISHIKYALDHGVKHMTFDNFDELYKIKKCHPESDLILRILPDDSKSICRFGKKFGASLSIVPELLSTAKELELNIVGISFHVGSGCFDASAFTDAVVLAKEAFDIGEQLGFKFKLLDIGGGFPGNSPTGLQFKDVAELLAPKIDELFPADVTVISEPGRYFVCSAFTLAVNITSRRLISPVGRSDRKFVEERDHSYMYYVNDGMYGSFNCITFDHAQVEVSPLSIGKKFYYNKEHNRATFPCYVWGPTCDSIDMIGSDIMLPKMDIGDWLVAHRMGAYTMAAASHFNGYLTPSIIYTNTELR